MDFFFNGIDGGTGDYLLQPISARQLARIAQSWLQGREPGVKTRGEPLYGVDPTDLSSSGWGVVFPCDADGRSREALGELLEHRRRQASAKRAYFKSYDGSEGYQPGESARQWLTRQGAGPGAADPERVPYYLLLVGDPSQIPFEFQFDLATQYAVGRLSFDHPREYGNYSRQVVRVESKPIRRRRRLVFWGAKNPDDRALESTFRYLMEPLVGRMRSRAQGWQIDAFLGAAATKARLRTILKVSDPPAVLFTASHGMGFGSEESRGRARLGALLCQDWPGPEQWDQPIPPSYYFAAEDVDAYADLSGMISFHVACYSMGVPRFDSFVRGDGEEPKELAPEATVASLPRRLLSKEFGGALAAIGHVDRLFGYSYVWPGAGSQCNLFAAVLARLLDGHPVGSAVRYLGDRYADLAVSLHDAAARSRDDDPASVETLARTWTAFVDARSYIILGDPAVRLQVVST